MCALVKPTFASVEVGTVKKRPRLSWRTIWFAGPPLLLGALMLSVRGLPWLAVAALIAGPVLFFGPWLLAPYSKAARHLAAPTDADLDRSVRVADRLGSLPVFGVVWRFAERMTGDSGRKGVDEYRRRRDEHKDD